MRALLVALLLIASGCAGTPATRARKVITAFELANASAPKFARPALKICQNKAVEVAKHDVSQGRADLQGCRNARALVVRSLHASVDATDASAQAIDVAEAAEAKDYSAAIAPATKALQDLWDALCQIGAKGLPPLPGVTPCQLETPSSPPSQTPPSKPVSSRGSPTPSPKLSPTLRPSETPTRSALATT